MAGEKEPAACNYAPAVTLRWDPIDFAHGQIHVSRAKNGSPSVDPLSGVELRALRRLQRVQEPNSADVVRQRARRAYHP